HFRMRTESRFRIGDAIGPLVINALRERTPAAFRAVRVQNSDAAAGLDPEIEDVPDVLVHERVLRSTDLFPDNHVRVLEQQCRSFSWKLRRPLLRRCSIGLRHRHGCHANHDRQSANTQNTSTTTIETFHEAPPEVDSSLPSRFAEPMSELLSSSSHAFHSFRPARIFAYN